MFQDEFILYDFDKSKLGISAKITKWGIPYLTLSLFTYLYPSFPKKMFYVQERLFKNQLTKKVRLPFNQQTKPAGEEPW